MDIIKFKIKALKTLQGLGLTDKGWGLSLVKNTSRNGSCQVWTKEITMSIGFLEANVFEEGFDVLLHEAAHALDVEMFGGVDKPHGQTFQNICKNLGCTSKKRDSNLDRFKHWNRFNVNQGVTQLRDRHNRHVDTVKAQQ